MKLFTVYDTTSETYIPPISAKTTAEMERGLSILAEQDKEHKFIKFASEHSLYEIGEFNEQSGTTTIFPEKKHISNLDKYIH